MESHYALFTDKFLIESRSLIEQLVAKNAPANAIGILTADSDAMLGKRIRELAETVVAESYHGEDPGRKNELTNALKQALQIIAEKTSAGAKVEVRLIPETRPPVVAADAPNADEVNAKIVKIEEQESLALEFDNEIDLISFNGSDPPQLRLNIVAEAEGNNGHDEQA